MSSIETPQLQEHYETTLSLYKAALEKEHGTSVELNFVDDVSMDDRLAGLIYDIEHHHTDHLSAEQLESFNQIKSQLNISDIDSIDVIKSQYPDDEEKLGAIDAVQAALDIVGFEPTVGSLADGANAIIYSMRSAKSLLSGEGKQAKEHLVDAGISAISLIPFADVIKILRLRKVPKLAKLAIKGGRASKSYAKTQKIDRIDHKLVA